MMGASLSGPGSRASHEAASASSPKASIPSAVAFLIERLRNMGFTEEHEGTAELWTEAADCLEASAFQNAELLAELGETCGAMERITVAAQRAVTAIRNSRAIGAAGYEPLDLLEGALSASAIEARRAETHSGSVEDESAVAKPDAQERSA